MRQVHEALADTRDTGYTTTLKLMQIMADKGLVTRNETARTHVYSAVAGEEQTQRQLVQDLVDRAFGGSAAQLVLRALERRRRDRRRAQGNPQADRRLPGETVMIDLRILLQPAIVDALAWTLLHFLWQGALLGFVAFLLLAPGAARSAPRRAMRSASPRSALMLITCVGDVRRSSRSRRRPIAGVDLGIAATGVAHAISAAVAARPSATVTRTGSAAVDR